MKQYRLKDMKGGWFIGDFEPACMQIGSFEAACQHYRCGDYEARHVHQIATEITLVASGRVVMNGQVYGAGDIIVIDPGEATDFRAIEDSMTMVVKIPSVVGDKMLA